ncbi:unnamed protein product [Plutella xylostella]|uniref:(diamondback moth) hypothetical protein n=1 Tax=Plutella xylostella TaxID=51655 RepID=A0A8S4F114_PLUXY|nr:unnamed protein product [Plutella xylostella]
MGFNSFKPPAVRLVGSRISVTMELYHVIIKSGPSPRPLAWSLEISSSETNDDWELIRAFGDKEHCRKLWDLRPERRRRKVRRAAGGKRMNRADKPTCSTQFTSPRPLENGEMHYGLGGVLARRVRISLRAPHPAPPDRQYYTVRALTVAASCSCGGHADRCVVGTDVTYSSPLRDVGIDRSLDAICSFPHHSLPASFRKWSLLPLAVAVVGMQTDALWGLIHLSEVVTCISLRAPHPAPPDRQYYTVRALTVAASCSCGGHADRCVVGTDGAKCICEDNTCGDHCALCCGGGPSSPDIACDVSRPGDVVDADCQCGERGQCAYDDTGAILCVNCTENRAGPLCDRCLAGFYSVASDGPCLPCDCDPEGSDGTCKYNKKERLVQCACVAGASGARCDVTACACDERGVVDPAAPCDQGCRCKPNVVGLHCDSCAAGYFGLAEGQGEGGGGCRECYCAGAADRCEPDPQQGVHMALPLGEERWLVAALAGNQTLSPDVDDQGKPYLISYEVEGWDSYYWTTTSFSGSQLSAYGGSLVTTVSWSIVRGDTGGSPTLLPDYVIVAEDGTRLCSTFTQYETPGETTLQSPLVEGHWRFLDPAPAAPGVDPAAGATGVNPTPGVRATRVELMDVLARVKMLMVRAHFHWDQDETHFGQVVYIEQKEGRPKDTTLWDSI